MGARKRAEGQVEGRGINGQNVRTIIRKDGSGKEGKNP
jgi:hypothetical protein